MTLLETKNLSIGYGSAVIQKELNISASKGTLICLLGTNGCGKSTLLRTLAALQPAIDGKIFIQGRNLYELSVHERSMIFSLVLTDLVDIENIKVTDLVALGRHPYTNWKGSLTAHDKEIIDRAITQVHLQEKSQCFFNHLSDGEKQRAMIAKALTQDTPIVLLDEPTAHLDLPNRIEIMMLLHQLSKNTDKCFILSTHELAMALQTADIIWLMHKTGIQTGIPEDLARNGDFLHVFSSNLFHFDSKDGNFRINHPVYRQCVAVIGDKTAAGWLIQALKRCGYAVTMHADTKIEANKDCFQLNINGKQQPPVYSIEEILKQLNSRH